MKERSDKHEWLIKRAKRYARHGNAAAVEGVMLQLLNDEPDDTVALAFLGAALFQSGRSAAAVVAYRRALDVEPDLGLVRYQLGLAEASLAHHEHALECWQPLLDDEAEFMAHYQSAMALLALDRAEEAGPLIETARKRMPLEHPLSIALDGMVARYCQAPAIN